MLRPATPLSILLFASFILLLISTISTPIIKGIPLARYQNVNFGVFGWCRDNGECSGVQIGWNTDDALPAQDDDDFNLPSSTRHSLSSLLIVHPVAALCNLVVLGLAIAAHLHSPSHSARYLLGLLILLLPTLLITLLAFLVDVLLFVPYLKWCGWLVLASTILITASGVVTCAMRRTLVSRKARKKRIAENAEMSGANFYARQAEESVKITPAQSQESKAPMVNGAPGADVLPTFATFRTGHGRDRPLVGSLPPNPTTATSTVEHGRFYDGQRSRSSSRPRQENFGAPLGVARSIEERPPLPNGMRGGYGPPRGRGGYPPRGAMSSRGNMNSRGPPPSPYGRGGYTNRGRGYSNGPTPPGMAPGGMMPAVMNRRPPPGYGPQGPDVQGGYGPLPQEMDAGQPYTRVGEPGHEPPSSSNYGPDGNTVYGPVAYGARAQSPSARRQSPYGARAQSPSSGRPPQELPSAMPPMPDQSQYAPPDHGRTGTGMDSDVLGMVEMQRVHPQPQRQQPPPQAYVPPRAGWTDSTQSPPNRKRMNSGGSDYMEDVDPRFAEPAVPPVPSAPPPQAFAPHQPQQQQPMPSILMAGRNPSNSNDPSPESSNSQIQIPRANSYEELHPGARSPVESETSNFTSVSERPINSRWQPGGPGEFNELGPYDGGARRQQMRRQDVLFSGNPDFELPGMAPQRHRDGFGPPRGRGGYGGMRSRPPPGAPGTLDSMAGDGRYPSPVPPQGPQGGVMREV